MNINIYEINILMHKIPNKYYKTFQYYKIFQYYKTFILVILLV